MKLISMSVSGEEQYIAGARANVPLAAKYYPDWELRFYVAKDYGLPNQVIMGKSKGHSGMFWRFAPAWEEDIVIVRDTDSRINPREVAAVDEWLASGKKVHSMHDHEHHRSYPIFGGMWGTHKLTGSGIKNTLVAMGNNPQPRVADMNFLRNRLFPMIQDDILLHSSHPLKWRLQPFPIHAPYDGFVGQQFQAEE